MPSAYEDARARFASWRQRRRFIQAAGLCFIFAKRMFHFFDSEVFRNFADAFRAFRVCRQIRTTTHLPLPKARTIRKRCNFDLDRFEPPHQFETSTNGKYKIVLFFQWTDPNYRKPNNDLLKTKKRAGTNDCT